MAQPIRVAVFPVAGLGTRFLPATKAVPKELLPVVDRPLIQYAVAEALEAGAERLVFVLSAGKRAIIDHFQPDAELEAMLGDANKAELLASVRAIVPARVQVLEAIQERPLGLGHAVLCARQHVGGEAHFAVLLPDDMLRNPAGPGAMAQLASVHGRTGGSVIAVERIDPALSGSYGIVAVDSGIDGLLAIRSMVEKPPPADAPSDLGVVGRYLLDSRIFARLEHLGTGAGGEIQLTDAIAGLLGSLPVHAHVLQGTRYDCGQRLGMLKANIDYALDMDELRAPLLAHLRAALARHD